MRQPHLWFILLSTAVAAAAASPQAEQNVTRAIGSQTSQGGTIALVGRVQQIHSPRLLIVENRLAEERRILVLLPERSTAPVAGTVVYARGMLRRFDQGQIGERAWSALESRARDEFSGQPVLVADSLETPGDSMSAGGQPLPMPVRGVSRREITVRPAALASLIGELAGFEVRVPYARVVGLFDSQSFLIDSSTTLPPPLGFRDRVLVLVDRGSLRVSAESLVASTVTVEGVARTLLGVQASGDAPWPPRLDRDAVKRLEVRAAVIARSVRTAEGVELTDLPPVR